MVNVLIKMDKTKLINDLFLNYAFVYGCVKVLLWLKKLIG